MATIHNIYKFIDFKAITVSEFSKRVAVSNGYFAKQRGTDGAVSSNIIEKIVIEYPEINTEWLLTGQGTMLKSAAAPPTYTAQPEVPYNDQLKTIEQLRKEVEIQKDTIINLQGLVITLQQQLATATSAIPANPITVKPNPAGKTLVTQL